MGINALHDAVRLRDGYCFITGEEPIKAEVGLWSNLQAAHVFPLAHQETWAQDDLQRCITDPSARGDPMNSVQNGLLLEAGVHRLFDDYFISINPDISTTFPPTPQARFNPKFQWLMTFRMTSK